MEKVTVSKVLTLTSRRTPVQAFNERRGQLV